MNNKDTLTLLFNKIHLIVFDKYTPQEQANFIDQIANILNEIIIKQVKQTKDELLNNHANTK